MSQNVVGLIVAALCGFVAGIGGALAAGGLASAPTISRPSPNSASAVSNSATAGEVTAAGGDREVGGHGRTGASNASGASGAGPAVSASDAEAGAGAGANTNLETVKALRELTATVRELTQRIETLSRRPEPTQSSSAAGADHPTSAHSPERSPLVPDPAASGSTVIPDQQVRRGDYNDTTPRYSDWRVARIHELLNNSRSSPINTASFLRRNCMNPQSGISNSDQYNVLIKALMDSRWEIVEAATECFFSLGMLPPTDTLIDRIRANPPINALRGLLKVLAQASDDQGAKFLIDWTPSSADEKQALFEALQYLDRSGLDPSLRSLVDERMDAVRPPDEHQPSDEGH